MLLRIAQAAPPAAAGRRASAVLDPVAAAVVPPAVLDGSGAGWRYSPVAAAVARRRPDVRHPEGALLDLRHRHRLRHSKGLVEAEVAQAASPAAAAGAAGRAVAAVPLVVAVGILGGVEDVGVESVGARDTSGTGSSFQGHIEQS